jgi:succinate dehydrogenase/fumarate reductase cytochrome b subunit
LHIPAALCIIESQTEEVTYMTRQTTGIIALVLGILVLVWPAWTHLVLGILLILIAVAQFTGKMKSLF